MHGVRPPSIKKLLTNNPTTPNCTVCFNENDSSVSKPMSVIESFLLGISSNLSNCCYLVAKSCLTLCNPMNCSPPGSSVHGISQARILEWVAISFSKGSSRPRDPTQVCCIAGGSLLLSRQGSPYRNAGCFADVPFARCSVSSPLSFLCRRARFPLRDELGEPGLHVSPFAS